MRANRDPLTELFGRDIAGMIYHIVWNDKLRSVNEQYKSLLVSDSKTGGIEFIDTYKPTNRPTFVFNVRRDSYGYREIPIYRWNKPFYQKGPDLPEHYWEIPELY